MSTSDLVERAKNTGEQLDHHYKDLTDRAARGEEVSDGDWGKLDELTNSYTALTTQTEALKRANAALPGSPVAGGVAVESPHADRERETGMVDPRGATMGEALLNSAGVSEFVSNTALQRFKMELGGTFRGGITNADGELIHTTDPDYTAGGKLTQPQYLGFDNVVERPLTYVRDLMTNVPVTTSTVELGQVYEFTNNVGVIPEAVSFQPLGATDTGNPDVDTTVNEISGGYKPRSSFKTRMRTGKTEWLAHIFTETEQTMQDIPLMTQLLNEFGLQGLMETNDEQILNGTGADANEATNTRGEVQGLLATGGKAWGIQTLSAASLPGLNDFDRLGHVIKKVRRWGNSQILMNPEDWFSDGLLFSKDANENYRGASPLGGALSDSGSPVWGKRVVLSDLVPAGKPIVGDFSQVLVLDRMRPAVEFTRSNRDHFERNIVDFRFENRIGVFVRNPLAICQLVA